MENHGRSESRIPMGSRDLSWQSCLWKIKQSSRPVVTYIHILNPKTGYPADSGLVSVSVISENGMLADALSTSLYLMGEEQAAGYWRTHADEFDMILETEDGTLYVTEGISQEIQTDNTTIVLNTQE